MMWTYHRMLVVGAAALVLLLLQAVAVVVAVMLDGLLLPLPWLRRRLLPLILEELAACLLPLERQVDRLSSQISLRHLEVEAFLQGPAGLLCLVVLAVLLHLAT
jgi:hypothetical protein